jgi:hypothetical protein
MRWLIAEISATQRRRSGCSRWKIASGGQWKWKATKATSSYRVLRG